MWKKSKKCSYPNIPSNNVIFVHIDTARLHNVAFDHTIDKMRADILITYVLVGYVQSAMLLRWLRLQTNTLPQCIVSATVDGFAKAQ